MTMHRIANVSLILLLFGDTQDIEHCSMRSTVGNMLARELPQFNFIK